MTTSEIARPKCKHVFDIPPGGAISVTLDGAAMFRAATTCSSCEIERLEARVSTLENVARAARDLLSWEWGHLLKDYGKECGDVLEAVDKLGEALAAMPDQGEDPR